MIPSYRIACCGKSRSGKFCPDCGKNLETEPTLSGLLRQCRMNAETRRRALESMVQKQWPAAWQERQKANAEKWDRWADELETLLAKSQET